VNNLSGSEPGRSSRSAQDEAAQQDFAQKRALLEFEKIQLELEKLRNDKTVLMGRIRRKERGRQEAEITGKK
jgi:hypothetical protein